MELVKVRSLGGATAAISTISTQFCSTTIR